MEVTLQPEVLRWARERAGLSRAALAQALRVEPQQVQAWEEVGQLRFTQAEKLAKKTHTPFGYLFLTEPPDEPLPIRDFRTVSDQTIRQPSPDLLETIYTMQRRQAWMRDFLIEEGVSPLAFVGSATLNDQPHAVASSIRETLGLEDGWASKLPSWSGALRRLRQEIEEAGILIVINGVVGNNTHRKLDAEEFRGFLLVDEYAPLIFINGRDAKAAQMFTFAHELAHLWLGIGGISNPDPVPSEPGRQEPVEQFCNAVAAEVVVPATELAQRWEAAQHEDDPFAYLARKFRVSRIVVARRALDTHRITREQFFDFYQAYTSEERPTRETRGGSFWNSQNVRIGNRFGKAVVQAAREGRLLYQDAYSLTGLKPGSFEKFAQRLGY